MWSCRIGSESQPGQNEYNYVSNMEPLKVIDHINEMRKVVF